MIPPFEPSGYLPSGIHPATLAEIAEGFGNSSEIRRVQLESIRWMIDLAKRAGAVRIILNGSFTTDILEPNDVDCVLLFPLDPIKDVEAFEALEAGIPFLDIKIVGPEELTDFVDDIFAADRLGTVKGMIEVIA